MRSLRALVETLTFAVVFCGFAAAAFAAADTVVVKAKDGTYQPGAAKSWKATDASTVVFQLDPAADPAAVAKALTERLATAKVSLDKLQMTVTGIPKDALLDQLSTLSLSGSADPLADLAGLGGGVTAMNSPEGGGSIRASKPTSTTMRPNVIKEHNPEERYEADVVEIKQVAFPSVTLKLKLRKIAKAGDLRAKLHKGGVIEASVVYSVGESGVDLSRDDNKRNLVSWYLNKGDHVVFHPLAAEADKYQIDWITRQE